MLIIWFMKHSLLSCRLPQSSFGISLWCLQHNKASLGVQKSGLVAFLVFLSSDLSFYELGAAERTRIPLSWLAPSVWVCVCGYREISSVSRGRELQNMLSLCWPLQLSGGSRRFLQTMMTSVTLGESHENAQISQCEERVKKVIKWAFIYLFLFHIFIYLYSLFIYSYF